LGAEAKAQTVNVGTKDTADPMLAFAERREPRIEGALSWAASSMALRRRGCLSFHDLTSP
jgi:hypothetical protein